MNDFQNIGVFLQLAAMLILFLKIMCTRECTGLSGRTQLLHALVFTTRFLDLPDELNVSVSAFVMKIVYLFLTYMTVAAIFIICRGTYEREFDSFRIDYLTGACITAAMIASFNNLDILSILWYFSVFLETFAILPQIFFSLNAQYVGSSLVFYIGLLASYRIFYVVHWAYTIYTGNLVDSYFVVVNGTVQLLIYCAYFAWMVPLFRARYAHLRNVDTLSDVMLKIPDEVPANGIVSNAIKAEC